MHQSVNILRILALMLALLAVAAVAGAAPQVGETAPDFTLKDIKGDPYALGSLKNNPMTVLFFFDASSRSSQEALMTLDKLTAAYKNADLMVWGITRSERQAVDTFVQQAKPGFPVLLDDGDISKQYNAKIVLPVICTLAPGLKITDYYQGGGKTIEQMMVGLAQRQLNRNQPQLAMAISKQVNAQNPDNLEARSVQGFAAIKEGNLEQADKVFSELSKKTGAAELVGKEGQAAVLARKGKSEEALKLVAEVEKKDPKRGSAQIIKGDVLAQQGKTKEAEAAYQLALADKQTAPYKKAEAYNRLGQHQSRSGKYGEAIKYYDQAVELDPYYLEPTSNKGVAYEKEGHWEQALQEYRKALTLDAADTIAATLARKAEEMLALQKDQGRKQRIDKLVKELVERFQQQKSTAVKQEDTWTSRPMVISFVDFEEKGGLAPREGLSAALVTQLGDLLNASGRVRVVERVLMERLLEELNIGSSALADQNTALQLGRVLAAKLITTGSIFYLPNTTMLSMRLIDTETTAVPKTFTANVGQQASLDRQLFDLNRDLLSTIIQQYPLRGYVVQSQDETVMLNLGAEQGVVTGTRFSVVEEAEPVVYKGRTLDKAPKIIGELEVVTVEPDLSHARVIQKQRALKTDDKVQEILQHAPGN